MEPRQALQPAHAQLDIAQLPPAQERIQKLERNQTNNDDDRQRVIDEVEIKRLDGLTAGNHAEGSGGNIQDTIVIINAAPIKTKVRQRLL